MEKEKAAMRTKDTLARDLAAKRGNKDKHSVVYPCLSVGRPDDSVLKLFPPSSLHLII